MQHFGKAALRVTKNYTKGYSDTQAKVRDATSNDPWGPSGTQMNEIAQLTYNQLSTMAQVSLLLGNGDADGDFQKRFHRDHGDDR
jgi:epsin